MNTSTYEAYWQLLEPDRRYRPAGYEEVVLRTLCGCEQRETAGSSVVRKAIRIHTTRYRDEFDSAADVTYKVRNFRNTGRRNEAGLLIYLEEPTPLELEAELERLRKVEQQYKQLWESVYGVDKGL